MANEAGQDLAGLELTLRRHALRIAGQALERWLNDHSSDEQGPTVRCTCGREARYAGRLEKCFVTVLGDLRHPFW